LKRSGPKWARLGRPEKETSADQLCLFPCGPPSLLNQGLVVAQEERERTHSLDLTRPEDDQIRHLPSVNALAKELIVVHVLDELGRGKVLVPVETYPLDDVIEAPAEGLGVDSDVLGRDDLGESVDEGHVDVWPMETQMFSFYCWGRDMSLRRR
jgi:hypothetical protein